MPLLSEWQWSESSADPESHLSHSSFQCEKCHKLYNYKRNLDRHVKYECGLSPQFQCPFCGKLSKLKSNLMKHVVTCRKADHAKKMNFMKWIIFSPGACSVRSYRLLPHSVTFTSWVWFCFIDFGLYYLIFKNILWLYLRNIWTACFILGIFLYHIFLF